MSLNQKIFAIILILSTITSIVTVSHTMYLYFGAYRTINFLSFSIKSRPYYNSTQQFVEIVLCVENPTEYALKINYIAFKLRLDNNPLGEGQKTMYYPNKFLDLQPFKSDCVTLKLDGVPNDKVDVPRPKIWVLKLSRVDVYDVPYLGGTRLLNISVPPFKEEGD